MYRTYADYLNERFNGKVQKLTVNVGFTCPNRDGTKGYGGCSYCNNTTFSPAITDHNLSVREQLERSKAFFGRKYSSMKYLAYFQSYTNTYSDVKSLVKLYEEALSVEGIVGIIIGTRPDTISTDLLEALSEINKRARVVIEFGAESSHNITLGQVNRCHTWEDTVKAVAETKRFGIDVGLHFIMGLPGETREMMLETVRRINDLNVDTVKFHQLQIVKNTRMAKDYERGASNATIFEVDEYLDLCCEIIETLKPSIAIERFTSSSPDEMLIAPRWGLKNYQFTNLLNNRLKARNFKEKASEF